MTVIGGVGKGFEGEKPRLKASVDVPAQANVKLTGKWGGLKPRWTQVLAFRRLADNNTVLGCDDESKRNKFVVSPIYKAMHGDRISESAVSVVMVPQGLGKTTAARMFLQEHKKSARGIAICGSGKGPFVVDMLEQLGLSTTSPPQGWLQCLIEALAKPKSGDERKTYLILDGFGSHKIERDVSFASDSDSNLVLTLKTLLRNTAGVRTILMTSHESCAKHLLSLNNLVGIQPLEGAYEGKYPDGKWKDMTWSKEMLKKAILGDPQLRHCDVKQIETSFEACLKSLPSNQMTYPAILPLVMARLGEGSEEPRKEHLLDHLPLPPFLRSCAA